MKLTVREWGTGTQIAVLVHGLFSDSTSWYRVGPALADRGYRVLAPDLRGHGRSPRGRYSPHDWAMDLLDTLPSFPALALGHSLGGLALGMVAEILRPGTVVYLDPAWRIDAPGHERNRALWSSWLKWTDQAQLQASLGPRWPEHDVRLRWDSMWRADPGVVAGLVPGGGFDLSPERASMPSLVLASDPSEFIVPEHAADLARRGLTVHTVQGSGHSYFREDADAFLALLDAWLADRTGHFTSR
ncbi:alpha/beta fold hydrolase [Amycolatopsis pithecellobii]|uniref:Alpha/beta fold hydrolase n=1 Tax=Amycolatopsis pithecellobii TaxID=664692 RepID=A0A6N7YNU6_9PSEU|nr:alpha/beta hydrolase [Amycolatopsis pithecellobii]MTD54665.1 alpha/beta fold hydrolase [Amycolatopsis pithecellobii]